MRSAKLVCLTLLTAFSFAFAPAQERVHKVVAPPGALDGRPGVVLLENYGSFSLYRLEDAAFRALPPALREQASIVEMDRIHFSAATIDVRDPLASIPVRLRATPSTAPGLQLVQFVGPIKPEWLAELRNLGVRPVQYIHSNAYLVWADAAGRTALERLLVSGGFVQFIGPHHPFFKLGPSLLRELSGPLAADRQVPVT